MAKSNFMYMHVSKVEGYSTNIVFANIVAAIKLTVQATNIYESPLLKKPMKINEWGRIWLTRRWVDNDGQGAQSSEEEETPSSISR